MTAKPEPLGVVYNGSETYSSGMENSRKVVRTFIKQVLECVEFLLEEDRTSSTICIAEFGSADGGVSLELMNTLIDYITMKVDDHTELLLVYEDQLLNDYNVLFKTVHTENSNFLSGFHSKENVHILASATSMYRKCLPIGFVDLAFSSMSSQWLSEMPCHIRAGIFQSDCDTEELEAYRQQWQKDWKQFLICRAQELRLGGYLAVISFITDDEGRLNDHVGENSFQFFTCIWKEFEQSGKITQKEFLQTTCSTYVPSKTELLEPFHSNMQTNLHLVDYTRKDVELSPGLTSNAGEYIKRPNYLSVVAYEAFSFAMTYSRGGYHDSDSNSWNIDDGRIRTNYIIPFVPSDSIIESIEEKEKFIEQSMKCIRPWLYNILHSGLSTDRTEEDKGRIVEDYFRKLRNILEQKSEFSPILYRTVCVVAKRV